MDREQTGHPEIVDLSGHILTEADKAELISRLSIIFPNCKVALKDNEVEATLHKSVERSSFCLTLNDQILRMKFNRENAGLRQLLYGQLFQ